MRQRHFMLSRGAAMVLALSAVTALYAQGSNDRTIVLPAISFSAQDGGEVKAIQPSRPSERMAAGTVHFWHTPGHWLEWTIDDAAAGEYQVGLHYATKFRISRGIRVNGEPVKALGSFSLEPSGRWTTWTEATLPAPVALKQGRNVLRLTCLDDKSAFLSEIRLAGPGKDPIVVKAPRFSAEGGGRVQVLTPPTQGYTRGWTAKGHWLEWTVEDAAAGPCDVYLHYAADDLCPRELRLNGEVVKGLESFAMDSTGDDRNWREAKLPAPVVLKEGRNVLRLTSLGGADFGLSAIRLVSPPAKVAAAPDAREPKPAETPGPAAGQPKSEPVPVASMGPPLPSVENSVALTVGQALRLGDRQVTVRKFDVLPYVDNDYSRRYVYESYDSPKLRQLREMYKLDEVIASGKDEFEKQLMLMEWVWNQWDFGHARERYNLRDPFEILEQARREHKFQCMHSAAVLMAAANSLGWVCRQMAIPQHTFNEIWSNQHQRWVMVDATSNYCPERNGVPLNTYELRQALCYENGKDVVSLRRKDGQLTRTPKDPKYGTRLHFVGYIPNTNNLVSGPQYGKMFITKDKLCEGKSWHTRECPKDPAVEPYFPINQAAMALVPEGGGLKVTLGTMTPNFKEFQVRIDGGQWKPSDAAFTWNLHDGANRLEARSVNLFGVEGPLSTVELAAGQ